MTGTASSFAAKYWATRAGVGSGQVVKVKQVNHRGGDLDVIWDEHFEVTHGRISWRDLFVENATSSS